MRIIIPGGSGQVGAMLARHFHQAGHQVLVLSRTPAKVATQWRTLPWIAKEKNLRRVRGFVEA